MILNETQAYKAMFAFLEKHYELTNSSDIGSLLGSMQLLEDGKPTDPALWIDWIKAMEDNFIPDRNK